jgi:adenine-specific DNA-methyltransferase
MQEWLKSNPVNADDMLRHDKWLCMMMPRVKLLFELMADGGVIAITIDNNELPRLWSLMDQIFGENRFVACAPWLSEPSGGKEKTGLRTGHEYVLIYSKNDAKLTQDETDLGELSLADGQGEYLKGRELRKWGGVSLREDRKGQWFPLTAPDGTEVWPIRNDGKEGHWRWGKNNPDMQAIIKNPDAAHWEMRPFDTGVLWDNSTARWVPYEKVRSSTKGVGWKTWLDDLAFNADGTRVIKEIFGEKKFDTPKPVELAEWVMSLVSDDEILVLDSFAGSGTTAHAAMRLNQKDGGNRKFILVECEDYADSITAERVRRVINGYAFSGTQREELLRKSLTFTDLKQADKLLDMITSIENLDSNRFDSIEKKVKNGELLVEGLKTITERVEGLGGSFTFCTLGAAIEMDKMLTGETLPSFEQLGALLYHMATSESFVAAKSWEKDGHGYLGESVSFHVWLIYRPDLDFLKSRDAALTLSKAKALVEAKPGKRHLVFAPAKFVSQELLADAGLQVEFAPLPFALYRIERS